MKKATEMPKRKIIEGKAFTKAIDSYFLYKSNNFENLNHAKRKFIYIYQEIARISELNSFPCRKVKYRNSSNLQYFGFQKHLIFFKLNEFEMQLKYFVAAKRIRKSL